MSDLTRYLSETKKGFPADRRDSAVVFLQDQPRRWRDLIENIRRSIGPRSEFWSSIDGWLTQLRDLINDNPTAVFRIDQHAGEHRVRGLIPLLPSEDFVTQENFIDVVGGIVAELDQLYNSRMLDGWNMSAVAIAPVQVATAKYLAEKLLLRAEADQHTLAQTAAEIRAKASSEFDEELARFRLEAGLKLTEANLAIQQAQKLVADTDAKLAESSLALTQAVGAATEAAGRMDTALAQAQTRAAANLKSAQEEFGEHTRQQSSNFEAFISSLRTDFEKRVEGWIASQRTEREFRKPVELFKALSGEHMTRYMSGRQQLLWAVLIVTSLALAGVSGFTWLMGLSDPATPPFTARGTLAVITLVGLLGAAAWLLRIYGRLVTDSLTLAQDAAHRSAVADTFLSLLADAKISESDKSVMIGSIFRPLPGTKQEEIEPTTALGVVKDTVAALKSDK